MTYNEWIQLGFERVDIDDIVEEQATGYGGYFLQKQVDKNIKIYVYWDNLKEPFLQVETFENKDKVLRQFVAVKFAVNLAKLY